MSGIQTFFCWVKLCKRGAEEARSVQAAGAPGILNGGIPPFTFSGVPLELLNGGIPPHVLNGGIPPGSQLGGFFASGWWAIDEHFSGDPDSALFPAFAPVAGSRDDAIGWLKNNPGWLDESVETYFLMMFTSATHGV